MSVGFADFAGFGAAGLGRRNFGVGFRESCWAKLGRYPRALGAVFVCRNGRPAEVEHLGLLLGVSPLDGLALGWAWDSVLSGAVRLFHPVGQSSLAVGKCHTMLLLVHGHVGCSWVVVRVGWFWGVSSLVGDSWTFGVRPFLQQNPSGRITKNKKSDNKIN